MISNSKIEHLLGIKVTSESSYSQLGWANSVIPNTLTFMESEKYVAQINNNTNITGVITTLELSDKITSKKIILSDDPVYDFHILHNSITEEYFLSIDFDTIIDETAKIHPSAVISNKRVKIGKNTKIEPNVTIYSDVYIGNNCTIQAGSVIGCEGFQYKNTSKGIVGALHDGNVIIENNVVIGANNCIDKGIFNKSTIVRNNVKVDNLVQIAHNCDIGENTFITGCAAVGGSVTIGANSFLGPSSIIVYGSTIGENVKIGVGAVVLKNVSSGQTVFGNPAKVIS